MTGRGEGVPALLILLIAGGLACNGSILETGGLQGILAGQVSVGPFCPVEIPGQDCPPPPGTYEAIRVLVYGDLRGARRFVAEARPDAAGRFELRLVPGTYRVTLEHSIGIPGSPPEIREARVEHGAITMVAFDVDTGIR